MSKQGGQALVEGLLLISVLMLVWFGIAGLGRLQDMALQASHGSRHAAFSASRYVDQATSIRQIRSGYFLGPSHQWSNWSGQRWLHPDGSQVRVTVERTHGLADSAQVGGSGVFATRLRNELHTADAGVLRASVSLDVMQSLLNRQTAILIDSGHSSSDAATQRRLTQAPTAWASSSERSYKLARETDAVIGSVDAAWPRQRPDFDWLQAWVGRVPEHHLQP